MPTRTRVKKIDADTHFLPAIDMEELRQLLHVNWRQEMRIGIDFLDSGACCHGFVSSLVRLPAQHD